MSGETSRPIDDERVVDRRLLSTYLDDHVAGATVGLARVQRMADAYLGTRVGVTIAPFVDEFRAEREFLVTTTKDLGVHVSRYKVVGAVVAERLGRLKPNGRLVRASPLSALLECELLRGAITGKLNGWRSLAALPPELAVDRDRLADLQGQAERQVADLTELLDWLSPRALTRPSPPD